MTSRDKDILKLRIQNIGIIATVNSDEENFQNKTLRPILKLQNELFILIFINYAIKNKNVFFGLNTNKKLDYIDNALLKDFKFRQFTIGLVIALFTNEEYSFYSNNSSNVNKRIVSMLAERLKSNIQLLVKTPAAAN